VDPTYRTFERYRRLLGVDPGQPDLALLSRIVRAHVTRIPFENVSKLYSVHHYGRRRLPTLEEYLDGIETNRFGGTCYINNHSLSRLLLHLGFDVSYCGAQMTDHIDVHTVILVRVDGEEFLVDTGYGAPFLEPLPRRKGTEVVVELGRERYVLNPIDEHGRSQVDHFRHGRLIHGYRADPAPRNLEHFSAIIAESYEGDATFLNSLTAMRFFPGRSVAVINDELIENSTVDSRITPLPEPADRVEAIVAHFGMPRAIVQEALSHLGELQGIHGGPVEEHDPS
jgi:N-hydroxyarylamine O-acetyltransferase